MNEANIKEIQQLLNCTLEEDGKNLRVIAPWNDETITVEIESTPENIEIIKNIKLNPCLSAIYHFNEHKIEFIFAGVDCNILFFRMQNRVYI